MSTENLIMKFVYILFETCYSRTGTINFPGHDTSRITGPINELAKSDIFESFDCYLYFIFN